MESAGTLKFTAVKFNIVVCLVVVPYVAEAYYVQEMDVETEQKKKTFVKPLCVVLRAVQSFRNGVAPWCC